MRSRDAAYRKPTSSARHSARPLRSSTVVPADPLAELLLAASGKATDPTIVVWLRRMSESREVATSEETDLDDRAGGAE